jgi:BioD-like phosphotransacetylase family protein
MSSLLIAAPEPLCGKTTIAVALGQRFRDAGRSVALVRLAGDGHAEADAGLYEALPSNDRGRAGPLDPRDATTDADVTLIEAPAGDAHALAGSLAARALVVAAYADPLPADLPSFCGDLGDSCAGIVINRVPRRRLEATRAAAQSAIGGTARLVALIPEDRTLAAPSLGAIAEALEASASGGTNGAREDVIDRPVISSISADPAQGYFARHAPNAVIVRSDKPDQQLGALNAGVTCLIVTGGFPLVSYVIQRAEEESIPILATSCDTVAAVQRLEALYAVTPFSGRAKVERAAQLAGEIDISSLG